MLTKEQLDEYERQDREEQAAFAREREANRTNDQPGPVFKHDCTHCQYVGHVISDRGRNDLYYHHDERPFFCTVVARRSSDGGDYSSGLPFVGMVDELTECYRLATAAGLVDGSLLKGKS